MAGIRVAVIAGLLISLPACVSSRMADTKSDRLFREGRYADAAERLRDGLKSEGNGSDRLLYLLDLGLSLHAAGDYAASSKVFLEADKYAEVKDYTSLSEEAGTLLTSENTKDYRGEDFENVLISTYLAMNYALEGLYEDSMVEAKRVNRKLERMITEGQRPYKQNAFARYLSGILYEAAGEPEEAYLDYKKTHELMPEFRPVGIDLWRVAGRLRDREAQERWSREFSITEDEKIKARRLQPGTGAGEIVVLYENGISPLKQPNPDFSRVPRFYPRPNPVDRARVEVDGRTAGETVMLHDIESTAIANLEQKYAALVAKRLAGIVAKEVVAHQIEKNSNEFVGFLARVFFHASDQADIRSWNLLPRDLKILRVVVDGGEHEVRLTPIGGYSSSAEKDRWTRKVRVPPGKRAFVNFRYTP